jgi:hypothetical protein
VYPLGSVHVVDEVANLRQRIVEIAIVGYVDLLFLDHANDALGRAVLSRFTNRSHTDLDTGREQQRDILRRGVLNALISMMHGGRMLGQGALERHQGQLLAKRAREVPAADIVCEDIHDTREVDKASAKMHVYDIANPDKADLDGNKLGNTCQWPSVSA